MALTLISYDANGNAITRNGYGIQWTSYNYPFSIATSTENIALAYGPDRQRWQQNYNSGAEITNYIGRLMEQVIVGGTKTYRYYVNAGNEPIAVYSGTSSSNFIWDYFLTDYQGSVAGITDATGVSIVGESFTPFGARRNPLTWSGVPSTQDLNTVAGISRQGYTFQTALGLSMGLNHMNGRVQDAITGRFLSADPFISAPDNTQNYNPYAYTYGNPMSGTDPTGFEDLPEVVVTASPEPTISGDLPEVVVTASPEPTSSGDLPEVVVKGAREPYYWWCAVYGCTSEIAGPAARLGGSVGPATQTPTQPVAKSEASDQGATSNGDLQEVVVTAKRISSAPGPLIAQEPITDPVLDLIRTSIRTGKPVTPEELQAAREQWSEQLQNRTAAPNSPDNSWFGKLSNFWDQLIQYLGIVTGSHGDIDPGVVLVPTPCPPSPAYCGA